MLTCNRARVGSNDWISYHDGSGLSFAQLKETASIDFAKPDDNGIHQRAVGRAGALSL